MKRKKALIIVAIAIVVIATITALLLFNKCNNNNDCVGCNKPDTAHEVETFEGVEAEYHGKEYCEVPVEFGNVKRSATAHKTIRLINRSDSPIVLLDYTTQCRCMWLEFEREPIAPNEYADITLSFDSRGEWGTVGNYMEITTSIDSAPIILWIGAEIE